MGSVDTGRRWLCSQAQGTRHSTSRSLATFDVKSVSCNLIPGGACTTLQLCVTCARPSHADKKASPSASHIASGPRQNERVCQLFGGRTPTHEECSIRRIICRTELESNLIEGGSPFVGIKPCRQSRAPRTRTRAYLPSACNAVAIQPCAQQQARNRASRSQGELL